ncbi:hypothetical protein HPB48_008307 [Haemaphysalis longicornis]|uniref:Gamma-interferon inducible lysosomal thiol reductase n=1 Tax=Haemaphysalis longicornis TaxID=44386 RepID=A0A9J6FVE0_HAELO|nr:hypothetical protein HPB48_008307 [Haemaphysalis longicornis]
MKPRSVVGVLSALLCFLATIYVCHCQKTYYQASSSVSVVLYYECLCPYSRAFITQQLWPTYSKLESYMKVKIVPYGNAKMITGSGGSKFSFQCQHGANECYGNKVQASAASMAKSMKLLLKFLNCMSQKSNAHLYGKSCAYSVGSFRWSFIEKCARGRQGDKLLRQMDSLTRGHWPRIGYVPYVEVNGHLNPRATTNLFSLICELLGKPKPKICLAE